MYATKVVTKMKKHFLTVTNEIKFNEPVLKPGKPE